MTTCYETEDDYVKKKVVGLLYLLLTDVVPFGDLEQLLRQNVNPINERTYYNEHMLSAAEDLYKRFIAK